MDIVDEFVVTLGLDPSGYKKEMAGFRDDLRKSKEETRRTARDMESDGRRAAESFSRLKNEIVGLFLVVAGGRSLGGFITDLIHGAAETGRFAQNIGMATERVSVWEMAVQSMGGTAQDARAALAALNTEYTNYMLTGRAVHDADLAALGISARDLRDPEQLALTLAERRSHITQREFTARLQRLGLPDSFIRTLGQGRHEVESLLDRMERIGPITDRDTKAAQEFERQLSALSNRIKADLRPEVTWLLETGLPFLEQHSQEAGIAVAGLAATVALLALRFAGLPGLIMATATALAVFYERAATGHQDALSVILSGAQWLQRQMLEIQIGIQESLLSRTTDPVARQQTEQRLNRLRERLSAYDEAPAEPPPSSSAAITPAAGASGRYNQIRTFFRSNGYTDAQAAGIAGGIMAESGGNPNIVNRTSGAYGIGQWLGPRNRALLQRYGRNPSLDQQLQFFLWELRGGDRGGTAVGHQQSTEGVIQTLIRRFFRPAAGYETNRDIASARSFAGLGGARTAITRNNRSTTNAPVSIGSIVVYAPPGTTRQQAENVAQEIPRAIERRGVVVQANKGLN